MASINDSRWTQAHVLAVQPIHQLTRLNELRKHLGTVKHPKQRQYIPLGRCVKYSRGGNTTIVPGTGVPRCRTQRLHLRIKFVRSRYCTCGAASVRRKIDLPNGKGNGGWRVKTRSANGVPGSVRQSDQARRVAERDLGREHWRCDARRTVAMTVHQLIAAALVRNTGPPAHDTYKPFKPATSTEPSQGSARASVIDGVCRFHGRMGFPMQQLAVVRFCGPVCSLQVRAVRWVTLDADWTASASARGAEVQSMRTIYFRWRWYATLRTGASALAVGRMQTWLKSGDV
jgi:hypothetical protein